MTTKNVIAVTRTITPSFNKRRYSAYASGNFPSGFLATPTIIDTDIISGSTTGGEFGAGSYISIFGYSLGRAADLGTDGGARVYFRDPAGDNTWYEVANYRALNEARVWDKLQVVRVICQIGNAGSWTAGRVLDMKVVVNGTNCNYMNIATGTITNYVPAWFTIQPGDFWFASLSGDDTTGVKNDITNPFRYVQKASYTGTTLNGFTGIWATGNLKPGDTIVIRGGEWTDAVGFEGRWARFFSGTSISTISPNAPTGVSGHGYVHFVRYPGPILEHTPEDVHYTCPAQTDTTSGLSGGIQGGSSNSALRGCGYYVSVSGLRISGLANGSADGGFVDLQNSGKFWRVYDNELGPWVSGGTDYRDSATGGVGERTSIMFNWIHDIAGGSPLQTHGIYMGGVEGGTGYVAGTRYCKIGFNVVERCTGGSNFQFNFVPSNNYISQSITNVTNNGSGLIRLTVPTTNDAGRNNDGTYNVPAGAHIPTGAWIQVQGVGGVTNANGFWQVTNVDGTHLDLIGSTFAGTYTSGGTMRDVSCSHFENWVYNNWFDTPAKYNLNFGPGSITGYAWNNICLNATLYAFRIQPSASTAGNIEFVLSHNTGYNPVGEMIEMESNLSTGQCLFQHNNFIYGPNTASTVVGWTKIYNGPSADLGGVMQYDRNGYFDTRGTVTTKLSSDTNGAYGDPKLKVITPTDYTLQSGSPLINAATSTEVLATYVAGSIKKDMYGEPRSASTPTIGATEGIGV